MSRVLKVLSTNVKNFLKNKKHDYEKKSFIGIKYL